MPNVVVPDPVLAKPTAPGGVVRVCGSDGLVLGTFIPADGPKEYPFEYDMTDAEMDAIFAGGGGRPLADSIRDLEAGA